MEDKRYHFIKSDISLDYIPAVSVVDILLPEEINRKIKFFQDLEYILLESSGDRLLENYTDLKDNLHKYLSFTVCYLNDEVIAFSGLMQAHFAPGCRALTRTYYAKKYRENSLRRKKTPNLAMAKMLPVQIEVAMKLGAKFVFISIEGEKKRTYFQFLIDDLNEIWQFGKWSMLAGLHNTCRLIGVKKSINPDPKCWQTIAYLACENMEVPSLPRLINQGG